MPWEETASSSGMIMRTGLSPPVLPDTFMMRTGSECAPRVCTGSGRPRSPATPLTRLNIFRVHIDEKREGCRDQRGTMKQSASSGQTFLYKYIYSGAMFMPQERFKMFPTLPHPVVWELKEDITEVRRNFFFYVLELRSLESGGSGTDTRGLWPGVEPAAGGCERRRHAHHRRGMDAELRGGPVGNAGPHPGTVSAASHRDPSQRHRCGEI